MSERMRFTFDHPLLHGNTRESLKRDYQRWLELTKDWPDSDREDMEDFFASAFAIIG